VMIITTKPMGSPALGSAWRRTGLRDTIIGWCPPVSKMPPDCGRDDGVSCYS
jgi:hypothetical protein